MVPASATPRVVRRGPLLALTALGALLLVAVGQMVATGSTTAVVDDLVAGLPLGLLALVAAPVLVAIAARPQRGLLLLAALVPFNGLLLIVPGRPPFIEGWKEGLALYTLAWSILSTVQRERPELRRPAWFDVALLYLGLGAVSAVYTAVMSSPVQAAVGMKVGYFWMFAALAAWLTPLTARDRDRLVSILMAAGFVTSLWGIAQQAIGHEQLRALGYEYDANIRFTGSFLRSISSFPTPFNFAFFLTLVVLIGLPIALDEPRRLRNQAFLATLPVVGIALIFTFVRGAWLALALGLGLLAIRRYRVLLLPVPFALLSLLLLPGSFSTSAFQSESLGDRTLGWGQNLTKLLDAPFGRGIGTTGAAAEKALEVQGLDFAGALYQPDNQYFKALYEIGVPGFFLYAGLLIAMIASLVAVEPRLARRDRAFAMGLEANIVGALAASVIATWLEIFPNDLYLWLLVTIACAAATPDPESS